jgi:uncharacterized protein (DUF849 family)
MTHTVPQWAMRMKACLNGGRKFPSTAIDLAEAAAGAVAAGADALHVHPRDTAGRESLVAEDVGAAVAAIRAACPGVRVGVSTGLWMTDGDARRREALVRAWGDLAMRPDFASVNVHEHGFADLVAVLDGAGIGVEAGVWEPAEADELDGLPLERVLVEVLGTPADRAVEKAGTILERLDKAGYRGPRLLHGEGDACWPLVEHAGWLRLPTRIGLEDTLVMPDGSEAKSNAELVREAVLIWSAALPPEGPQER